MSGTGGAADPRVKAAVRMMKAHPTLSLPQAMWMAKFSESECKNRTMQMRVRRAHSAQMPMVGTDINFAGTPTMSSLSTQEGTITKTSIPTVSNALSAAAEVATALLFPAPQPEEPPRPTAQAKQKDRCHKLKVAVHAKKAHKRATSFYASELKKPKGKRFSADAISKIVKKNTTAMVHRDVRFNATLTTTTILATRRLRWEAEGIFRNGRPALFATHLIATFGLCR